MSRIVDTGLDNVRDRGVNFPEEKDPVAYNRKIMTAAQKIKRLRHKQQLINNGAVIPKSAPCTMKELQCSGDTFAVHACNQCTGAKKKSKGKAKEHEDDLQ